MLIINLIQLIPINGTFWIARWLRRQVLGYCHPGYLVNLSDTRNVEDAGGIPYAGLRVELSPDPAWQLLNVAQLFVPSRGKSVVQDHDISTYASKLLANARRRNR
jgi:triacylglycerol lipase